MKNGWLASALLLLSGYLGGQASPALIWPAKPLPAPAPAPSPAPLPNPVPKPVATAGDPDSISSRMLILYNAERIKKGVGLLVADPDLEKIASDWSVQQERVGKESHDGVQARLFAKYPTSAENVAQAANLGQAMELWLASPLHKVNICNPVLRRFGGGNAGRFFTADLAR